MKRAKSATVLEAIRWGATLGTLDLTPGEKAVGLRLAMYADLGTGKGAWPSQATLAGDLGFSERAVRGALARLEEVGAIRCTGRRHRVKMYDLVTGTTDPLTDTRNRNDGSAYVDAKPEAAGHVTGTRASRNRNDASDNHPYHPDREGGMRDESATRTPDGVHAAPDFSSVIEPALPATFAGATIVANDPELVAALQRLAATPGWDDDAIRAGLASLPAPKRNATGLLAKHITTMTAKPPPQTVTVAADEPDAGTRRSAAWDDPATLAKAADKFGTTVDRLRQNLGTLTDLGLEVEISDSLDDDEYPPAIEVLVTLPKSDDPYGDMFAALWAWTAWKGVTCDIRLVAEAAHLLDGDYGQPGDIDPERFVDHCAHAVKAAWALLDATEVPS